MRVPASRIERKHGAAPDQPERLTDSLLDLWRRAEPCSASPRAGPFEAVEPSAKLAELADLRLDVGHRVDFGLDLREPLGDRRQLVHLGQLRLESLDLLEPGLDLVEPLRRELPAGLREVGDLRSELRELGVRLRDGVVA